MVTKRWDRSPRGAGAAPSSEVMVTQLEAMPSYLLALL